MRRTIGGLTALLVFYAILTTGDAEAGRRRRCCKPCYSSKSCCAPQTACCAPQPGCCLPMATCCAPLATACAPVGDAPAPVCVQYQMMNMGGGPSIWSALCYADTTCPTPQQCNWFGDIADAPETCPNCQSDSKRSQAGLGQKIPYPATETLNPNGDLQNISITPATPTTAGTAAVPVYIVVPSLVTSGSPNGRAVFARIGRVDYRTMQGRSDHRHTGYEIDQTTGDFSNQVQHLGQATADPNPGETPASNFRGIKINNKHYDILVCSGI